MQSDFSWLVDMQVMLGSLDHGEVQACSISNVQDELRDSKEEAYKPKVISIGPLHKGATRNLQLMEEPKWHYMREFLERQGVTQDQTRSSEIRLEDCGHDILKLDEVIRASYGGNINFEPHQFAKIMIVDGCFLLEFLIRLGDYIEGKEKCVFDQNDPVLETEEKVLLVLNDITMLENQIPFIVLKKLYRKVFPDGSEIKDDHRVANIARKAFCYTPMNIITSGGAHILHLMHLFAVIQGQNQKGKRANQELIHCAAKLRASGVIILPKPNKKSQNHFADWFEFDICFSKWGELEIPTLYVKETTEVKWRNLIAWEQSRFWIQCKYTSYALFFKGLICCKHDIELLEEKGVLVNKSNMTREELLALFRNISEGVEHMDSSYSEICGRLNVYKGRKFRTKIRKLPMIIWHQWRRVLEIVLFYWRNWYRVLIQDHIPTVWKFIGVIAAIVLLALTIMQTYYSARG